MDDIVSVDHIVAGLTVASLLLVILPLIFYLLYVFLKLYGKNVQESSEDESDSDVSAQTA